MRFSVSVPASSANLGPGFDALALALGLYTTVEVVTTDDDEPRMIEGPELAGGTNLVLVALRTLAGAVKRPLPGCRISVRSDIPLARGLGSSAAAIVAGLVAANRLFGDPLDDNDILHLAVEIEGHGDNVAAALFGGVALVVPASDRIVYRDLPLGGPLRAVIFIPEHTGLTREARAVVPDEISRTDAVANAARCALLTAALTSGEFTLLGEAMTDRLHQPFRATLYPYLPEMIESVRRAGAYGASLSGAGPAVLALAPPHRASDVAAAMAVTAGIAGVAGQAVELDVDDRGAMASEVIAGQPSVI
ncbi:homoserine kinase [Nitrolancea hollandica]|uniref:Homoserine kinase n=1 Tax=Nitrolancea hollandica Lb TaxID=1129897 RepID=I4EDM3_9BACT|nr:homoserine kinase [Nitrolancea hollandica]CCF82785.1 Homoserine kinase [Nitrolancea hollandica Lb]